jgi:hypothetical protein
MLCIDCYQLVQMENDLLLTKIDGSAWHLAKVFYFLCWFLRLSSEVRAWREARAVLSQVAGGTGMTPIYISSLQRHTAAA